MNGVRLVWALLLCALAWPVQAATVRYVHTDALGSVVAKTDAAGTVVERREYEPYGAQLTPAVADGPGYTGHVQDAATGLVYMQARYYDDDLGRFLSVDPVTADANTGARFNRYQYAANNPYRFVDPDGRKEDERQKPVCQSGSLCNTSPGFRNSAVSGMVNRTPASARRSETNAATEPATERASNATGPTSTGPQGDVFFGVDIDLVGITGGEFGFGVVIDLDSLEDSGIYGTAGEAVGANAGIAIGGGYMRRELEGKSIGGDINVKAISFSPQFDDHGLNGASVTWGPGIGFSLSRTTTKTLSVDDVMKWIGGDK